MLQNTLNWYQGEIFEGKFILGFGILLILLAFIVYHYGNLPSAKALLWPLLAFGVLFTFIGAGGCTQIQKK